MSCFCWKVNKSISSTINIQFRILEFMVDFCTRCIKNVPDLKLNSDLSLDVWISSVVSAVTDMMKLPIVLKQEILTEIAQG